MASPRRVAGRRGRARRVRRGVAPWRDRGTRTDARRGEAMKKAALVLLCTLPALLAMAACASPIVGGNCESGYINCHGACIDPRTDPHNCAACGQSCPASAPFCSAMMCVVDAGPPDLGTDAGIEMGPRDLGPDLSFDAGYHG